MSLRHGSYSPKKPFPYMVFIVAAGCTAWLLLGAKTGILLFAFLSAAFLLSRQKG